MVNVFILREAMTEEKTDMVNRAIELQMTIGRFLHDENPDPWLSLDLTIAQLKSLFYINFHETTNSKSLAEALGVTPPNVTGIIDRLVEQGLVSREYHRKNRRMHLIKLTGKGSVLLEELRIHNTSRLSALLQTMNAEDLSALVRGLSSLAGEAEKAFRIRHENDLITE